MRPTTSLDPSPTRPGWLRRVPEGARGPEESQGSQGSEPYEGSQRGIVVTGLTKRYGRTQVIDEVSFAARPGRVTAFLGPNGAGKTTTLRIAAGLSVPDKGSVRYDGRSLQDEPEPSRVCGFSLDASAQHPGRSVQETLTLTALTCGVPRERVDEMLQLVGLDGVRTRRVGRLSLGMRQRLAVGCALLPGPRMLVLDEPANGLDVEGVLWIRHMLRSVADRGGTVLLSSHLLREVQAVADHVVVIDRGRIVADASLADLTTARRTLVRTESPHRLHRLLTQAGVTASVQGPDGSAVGARLDAQLGAASDPLEADGTGGVAEPPGTLVAECDAGTVGRLAATHGVVLLRLDDTDAAGLENTFLRLTAGEFAAQPSRMPPGTQASHGD